MFEGSLRYMPEEITMQHNHHYFGTAEVDSLSVLNNSVKTYAQGNEVWQRRKLELCEKYGKTIDW